VRPNRVFGALAALTACAVVQAAPAEYEASVHQKFASQRPVARIGLAPFTCPPELDCGDVEKAITERLSERTESNVVATDVVLDLMTRASMPNLEDRESRLIIGEGLGVDAFAFIKIKSAQVTVAPPSEKDKWKNVKRDSSVKRASVELRIVARDGTALAHVSGEAQLYDSIRSLPAITGNLVDVMLDRAWR
jgi:hypothetical protein